MADPHDSVIHGCHEAFSALGLPVKLVQAPMQEFLLELLSGSGTVASDTEWVGDCVIVCGVYGHGQPESALQKQLGEAFPEQIKSIEAQALAEAGHKCGGSGAGTDMARQQLQPFAFLSVVPLA